MNRYNRHVSDKTEVEARPWVAEDLATSPLASVQSVRLYLRGWLTFFLGHGKGVFARPVPGAGGTERLSIVGTGQP